MNDREPPPSEPTAEPAPEPGPPAGLEETAAGYIPPDPDEPPPVELWRAVGDVQPWGTLLVLFPCAAMFLLLAARHALDDDYSLLAWGASATGLPARESAWRLLASTFVHAGPGHLFFNATTLLIFGPAVERVFTRWGFWIVYAAG